MARDPMIASQAAFTLVELLVVIGIIALLVALLGPGLWQAKVLAAEAVCAGNLRMSNLAMVMYAESNRGLYCLEPTEHNPHPNLVQQLAEYDAGIIDAMYCPQAEMMETFADNPDYVPQGDRDSVVDTAENRQAGNISYVYWSFQANKAFGDPPWDNMDHWRNPKYFIPRQLTLEGAKQVSQDRKPADVAPQYRWVMSDFFRRGAPFPHARKHARGLNVCYQDSHVALIFGKPRDNYR